MAKNEETKKEKPKKAEMIDVSILIERSNIKPWENAALRVYANWKPGKALTHDEFNKTVRAFRTKRIGERLNKRLGV